MRFMMIVKASKNSEAGLMPSEEMISAMTKYNEELHKAGVLVALDGLQATSKGARVKITGGKRTVVDGPFPLTNDLIAGFWIINVKSKEEAVQWAQRAPNPHGDGDTEIEIRQFFELEDFPESEAVEEARKLKTARNKAK